MQEYEKEILGKYNIDVNSTRKVRGAVLCDTTQGVFLLREVTAPVARILALCELYEYLKSQGYSKVDDLIVNENGEYVTGSEDGKNYAVRRWYPARECDLRKPSELLLASGNLAKLHKIMHMDVSDTVNTETLGEEYERHNRELRKVRKFVRAMTAKGEFELAFLKHFDEMYQWTQVAEDVFLESGYEKLRRRSRDEHALVHGEYNYHNILMKNEERHGTSELVATVNFDKFRQDIQVEDLYYFLRKVMEKHGWKERLGDGMLNAYNAIKPLSKEETEYLKLRFLYPEKFWKIANTYYHSNKAWIPEKNIEKLHVAIRQTKEKERFINNIFSSRF